MNDLISKSKLKNELLKIPSEMGLIKKAWVMQAVDKQKTQGSNNTCNCKHNHNSNSDEPCCRCDSRKTNADKIRSMSDEDLLDFICSIETYDQGSVITIKGGIAMCSVLEVEKWLQSPVNDEVLDLENFEVRR